MAEAKQLAGAEGLSVNMVTPRGQVAMTGTDAVTAPGALGEFEVLPGHVPFLTALHPGVLVLGEKGARAVFAVGAGFLKVDPSGEVEILVQDAIAGTEVDAAAATAQLDKARAELEAWKDRPQDADYKVLRTRFEWARAQLDARARAVGN